MSLAKYRKVKYLGKGSYGSAILVSLKSNPKQTFVIKEILIGHLKKQEQDSAKKEVDVLRKMKHSNITEFFESFIENSKLYIVMEHADAGDLSAAINRRKTGMQYWPEDEVMRIFVQICLALKHVHNHNVLHRDLKSQNIFLTSKGIVKLGDFGIAKVLDNYEAIAQTQIGTPYYLSPEICDSQPYGRPSDIWALGVVLYELLALELPFQASSLPALVVKIVTGEPNWNKIESLYSPSLSLATKAMLNKNPDVRPSVRDLVSTDFFKMHISKLLSYTLLSNKGGAELDAAVGFVKDRGVERDGQDPLEETEHVEQVIEVERSRQRNEQIEAEKRSKEYQEQQARQRRHEEAREELRKKKLEGYENIHKKSNNVEVEVFEPPSVQRSYSSVDNDDVSVHSEYDKRVSKPPPKVNAVNQNTPQYFSQFQQQQQQVNYDRANNLNAMREEMRGKEINNRNAAPIQSQNDKYAEEMRLIYLENQAKARENKMRVRPVNDSPNLHRQQSDLMVQHANQQAARQQEYESAAKREYFANRAAAQQIKAKFEAYERGPSNKAVLQHNRLNEPSDDDDTVVQHYDRRNNGYGEGGQDRISMVKAQREYEKNMEQMERERLIREAHEQLRLERLRLEENKRLRENQQLAENQSEWVDEQDRRRNVHEVEESPYERQRRKEKQREDEIRQHNEALQLAAQQQREMCKNLRAEKRAEPVAFQINFNKGLNEENIVHKSVKKENNDVHRVPKQSINNDAGNGGAVSSSSPAPVARQRKGWGTPIAPKLTKGENGVILVEQDEAVGNKLGNKKSVVADEKSYQNGNDALNATAKEVVEDEQLIALYGHTLAKEVQEDEEAVLRCLEERKGRENEAREHAKIMFKKLREKRKNEAAQRMKQQANNKTPEADVKKSSEDSKTENASDKAMPSAGHHAKKPSLNDIMNSVSKASAEVNKAIGIGQARGYHVGKKVINTSENQDKKTVRKSDEIFDNYSSDEDKEAPEIDDLEKTLESWLKRHNSKKNLKAVRSHSNVIPEDSNDPSEYNNGNNNDDGDVADLQCMLAEALMNDEDEIKDETVQDDVLL